MLNQTYFNKSNPLSQTQYPQVIAIRPHAGGDHCHACRALIAGDVTEVFTAPGEIRFYCDFCLTDPDAPLPIALTVNAHSVLWEVTR